MSFFGTAAIGIAAAAVLLAVAPARAHAPNQSNIRVASCWAEGDEVACRSTRALAGGWNHVPVQVFDAAGRKLHATKTDGKGHARFARPPGEFHVLVGDRPGEAVEVDWRDVVAGTAARQDAR